MDNYKIRIPNREVSERVQTKAFGLGYSWIYNSFSFVNFSLSGIFVYENGKISANSASIGDYFENHKNTEISYQDFLKLGEQSEESKDQQQELINNQIQQQMSEIKLKCIKQPQRAKNITEGKEYNGIFINSDDTQVDSIEDAEYFQCVNNSGTEAKYRISLFEPLAPIAPAKLTMDQAIGLLKVTAEDVILEFNGNDIIFGYCGIYGLAVSGVNCSCGISSTSGIDLLFEKINHESVKLNDDLFNAIENYNSTLFIDAIFKAVIKSSFERTPQAFVLFSTTESQDQICRLMDEIYYESEDSIKTNSVNNPNSGNLIRAWLIKV